MVKNHVEYGAMQTQCKVPVWPYIQFIATVVYINAVINVFMWDGQCIVITFVSS